MKTKSQNQSSKLKSRSEQQLSTEPSPVKADAKPPLRQISFKLRYANRALDTEKLLALLKSEAPRFYALAEVVGKWVWIAFDGKQPSDITGTLAEFGFHWNNARQLWQHPCGNIPTDRATYDPRRKYGSYFAAD